MFRIFRPASAMLATVLLVSACGGGDGGGGGFPGSVAGNAGSQPTGNAPAAVAPAADVAAAANPVAADFKVETLSSKPEFVSGGDSLIRITVPPILQLDQVVVRLNGRDISGSLKKDETAHTLTGLIDGLKDGPNDLVATRSGVDEPGTRLTLTNYPIYGPILSGPHLTPYECRLKENDLVAAGDKFCSAVTQVDYFYRSTGGEFLPYEKGGKKPSDVSTASVSSTGKDVPYVIRVESGTVNRGIYRIAVLDDPDALQPLAGGWTPRADSWNGKLVVRFGDAAGIAYNQGWLPIKDFLGATHIALSRGFATMASTELDNKQHSNGHLQGETLMMLKEHFTERYGVPKWTVGSGDSGGGIQQYVIAHLYPGLLDGLQPGVAFPDVASTASEVMDCKVLLAWDTREFLKESHGTGPINEEIFKKNYLEAVSERRRTSDTKSRMKILSGIFGSDAAYTVCVGWQKNFAQLVEADNASNCGLGADSSVVLHRDGVPDTPDVVRCDLNASFGNQLGRDPGTGVVNRPYDNVGIQYGLKAFNDGVIDFETFADLNRMIGGVDDNGKLSEIRTVGNEKAIRMTYRSGLLNDFSGLGGIPIITRRPNVNVKGSVDRFLKTGLHGWWPLLTDSIASSLDGQVSDFHDSTWDVTVRQRIEAANGDSQNHLIIATNASRYKMLLGGVKNLAVDQIVKSLNTLNISDRSLISDWYAAFDYVVQQMDPIDLDPISLDSMSEWLDALSADPSPLSKGKVIDKKPRELVDQCFGATGGSDLNGERISSEPKSDCAKALMAPGRPRWVAGESVKFDTLKCQLKPVVASDYTAPGGVNNAQVAVLKDIFKDGVCDWTQKSQYWAPFAGPYMKLPLADTSDH